MPTKIQINYNQTIDIKNKTQIKFNTSIPYAPNSTRAELSAIIYLFLTLPSNYKIYIHLDNLSAIHILKNNLLYNHPTQTKINNWDIIHILNYLIKKKNIQFTTHKTKSHSKNSFHNIADLLAKQGTNKIEIQLNTKPFQLPLFFTWNQILLPLKIRKFCTNILSIQTFNKLIQLKTFRNLQPFNILQLTNIINSQNDNHKLYSLRNKIILNNLPTMANLNTRYPNLYLTPNYAFCNQYENTYHILSCTFHSINSYEILLNQITNTLNILNLNNTLSQTIFQIINHNNNSQNLINILLLFIQGIILTTFYDQINSLLKKTT